MTDPDELSKTIIQDRAARGQPISKLGYFCAPFRPQSGPLSDRVIKVYRSLADDAALDRLAQAHSDYVALLKRTNVGLPETGEVDRDLLRRIGVDAILAFGGC